MDKSTVPYLCGGTFFLLLEQTKDQINKIKNPDMLEHLIKQFNSDFKQSSPHDTFGTNTSEYKHCKVSKGMYLPFDKDVYIKSFDTKVQKDYNSALKNMEDFIQLFLSNNDSAMIWLTQALLELIKDDVSIPETDKFYALETGKPITKRDLLTRDSYCVSALLLGIWHFILLKRPDNENGQATVEKWCKLDSEKGAQRKFISTIGLEYNRTIEVTTFSNISSENETNETIENPVLDTPQKTNEENNKSIHFTFNKLHANHFFQKQIRTIIVTIAAIAALATLIIYLPLYSLYNQNIDAGDQANHNGDYLEAASHYHTAAETARKLPLSLNLYVKAYCREGDSYLSAGIKTDDQNYYARAFGIYGNIMNDHKYESSEYYIDALCGLSTTYMYTGHICNSEWNTVVEKIFEKMQNLPQIDFDSEVNISDHKRLTHWLKISFALDGYYQTAIKTDYTVSNIPLVLQNALFYNHAFTSIMDTLSTDDLEISYYSDYTSDITYHVQLLVLLANNPQVENAEKYAKQAINICEEELSKISLTENDITTYISLKYLINASNVALGYYYNEDSALSETYLTTAHDELISLLDLCKDNVAIEQKTDIAYQALFTKKCTPNEIQKILDVYQELFEQINVAENPKQAANWALNICDACKYVNETYGFSSQFWQMGQAVTELIIEDYVQNSQKEVYIEFKKYFHTDINMNTESILP